MSYVKDIPMKARKNPTNEQLLRRLRRPLDSDRDPRIKNDAYYALRHQGHPHASAIRAFRDQPPVIHQRTASADLGEYVCDPDELLFPAGSTRTEIKVEKIGKAACRERVVKSGKNSGVAGSL